MFSIQWNVPPLSSRHNPREKLSRLGDVHRTSRPKPAAPSSQYRCSPLDCLPRHAMTISNHRRLRKRHGHAASVSIEVLSYGGVQRRKRRLRGDPSWDPPPVFPTVGFSGGQYSRLRVQARRCGSRGSPQRRCWATNHGQQAELVGHWLLSANGLSRDRRGLAGLLCGCLICGWSGGGVQGWH